MTAVVVALILFEAATIAAFFMLAHKHEQRIDRLLTLGQAERAAPNPDTEALIALTENLCQRIQAPQQAIADHTLRQPVTADLIPPAITPDDDEAFWQSRLTTDELAERAMEAELANG